MKTNLSVFLLVLVAGFQSCTGNFNSKSENHVSDNREIEGASKLKVSGIFNLYLSQGNGDWLELDFEKVNEKFFKKNSSLDVYLTLNDLQNFDFEGVGNIKTETPFEVNSIQIKGEGMGNLKLELNAKKIDADFAMLGNINLKGKTDQINLTNDGMGNVDASDLIAQKMNLRTSGIGRVAVHCEGDLSLIVDGIGAVSYTGNPNVIKEEINGIGKVTRN
jgi:hypothetical protein